DGEAVIRRVTRRQSGPPKVYSLTPHEAWQFLADWEGWDYVLDHGEWKMAGPAGEGPFLEADLPDYVDRHPDLKKDATAIQRQKNELRRKLERAEEKKKASLVRQQAARQKEKE
ncbi:unnamed protein product, partial [Laminaria digitata]